MTWSPNHQAEFFTFPDGLPPQVLPGDFLHTPSPETKNAIFSSYLPIQEAEAERGRVLLARLEKLAPSVAEKFTVRDGLIDDFALRLINESSVDVETDGDVRSFVVMSYCWDPRYEDRWKGEYGEEFTIPFSSLIMQTVIQERQSATEGIWIDQVCINQRSEAEKNVAIPAMAALYKQARLVVVAIGDIEVSVEEQKVLRDFISSLETFGIVTTQLPFTRTVPPFMHQSPVLRGFWDKFLGSRWFTRAWCSHEMQLSQNLLFVIPCSSSSNYQDTSLVFKSSFVWYLAMLSGEIPSSTTRLSRIRDMVATKFDIYHNESQASNTSTVSNSFVTHTQNIMSLSTGGNPTLEEPLRTCDARRDKISIVLNSAGYGLILKRREELLKLYSSDDECFRQLLTVAIAAGDPLALCCTGPSLTFETQKSWLSRPGINARDIGSDPSHKALPAFAIDSMQMDDSPSSSWIQLDGFKIDNEVPPSEEALTAAVFMTLKCQSLGMGVPPANSGIPIFSTGPGYDFWDHAIHRNQDFSSFTRTIAAILDCGLVWMLETAELCGFPRNHLEGWKKDAMGYFQEGFHVQELIKMGWAGEEEGRNGVRSLLRFAMWLITWGVQTVHEYPLVSQGPLNWFPTVYESLQGAKLLIFSRLTAAPSTSRSSDNKPLEVFVPKCLAVDGYEKLARCWLVTPGSASKNREEDELERLEAEPSNNLTAKPMILESKTRIFSARPIGGLGFDVKTLSHVKIYGA
ncbi:hypothetical protein GLAREA_00437 [Glarea lozoyensis ATCC 20868]|uniref:Heterokaryon incompatibility domain-containing protein n=1 Tax=Glarea lozoyensis (strain ATCC 20868 / MF5171) TaxID=1116229 RepID=S3CS95_GLAL2|nr:uncharacterized protein GLAREA_00437 [Glarea lozoyensis ATCC 20868]EPE29277.1 hypothetical protein GLAREA_00437 [Glarea lozoyensis ATCC 20868]